MKKILLVLVGCLICGCVPKGQEYAKTCVVVEVTDNEVIAIDFNGEEWRFGYDDTEEWCEEDLVSMIMNDKGTKEIYDDEIVSVHYNGWLQGDWGYQSDTDSPILNH